MKSLIFKVQGVVVVALNILRVYFITRQDHLRIYFIAFTKTKNLIP